MHALTSKSNGTFRFELNAQWSVPVYLRLMEQVQGGVAAR
jgi:hypothetical protein